MMEQKIVNVSGPDVDVSGSSDRDFDSRVASAHDFCE
jgi:hypothetical protein